jgi:diguanylate cyclase (GGDEF)-like protein
MPPEDRLPELPAAHLMAVIRTQTEIAKLGPDLAAVMALVAERARACTGATGAVVELAEGDDMVYRAAVGGAAGALGLRLGRRTSLSGPCVQTAQTLRCGDSEADPRVDREACRRVGVRSMVVVPLIHLGEAVGALKVYAPSPNAFGDADARLLDLMSELIAAAMFHATRSGAAELFERATRDPLTGLANRALFHDRLRQGLAVAAREGTRLGVVAVDMDGLKAVNDRLGHRAGDAAICELADRLASTTRQADTVARLGGDEFGVVLSVVGDRDDALQFVRRAADRCHGVIAFEGESVPIGASFGLALYLDDGDRPDALLDLADRGMYTSKRARQRGRCPTAPTLTAVGD